MGIYLNLVGNDIVFFLLILVFYIFLKCVLYNKYCGMFNDILVSLIIVFFYIRFFIFSCCKILFLKLLMVLLKVNLINK